jgi:hypothetical protein
VHTDRMSRLVSLVALDPQPLPCRAPSGIAHSYLHNKSGPLKARGVIAYIALSTCATTLLAGVDPTPPLGQHMPRHVLLPIFRHQQRDILATKERRTDGGCDAQTGKNPMAYLVLCQFILYHPTFCNGLQDLFEALKRPAVQVVDRSL